MNVFEHNEDGASGVRMVLVRDDAVAKNANQMSMPQLRHHFHVLLQSLR